MENNFNLSTLSDAEFNEFYANISREILARREQKSQKAEAWKDVVKALNAYLQLDDITVYYIGDDNRFMNLKDSDFNDAGLIIIS